MQGYLADPTSIPVKASEQVDKKRPVPETNVSWIAVISEF